MKTSNAKLTLMLILIMLGAFAHASDQVPAPPQTHPIALVGGTVFTVSGEPIESGMVLFENGKITAVGKNLSLPEGTEVIDVSGKRVYPAFIDANSTMGLVEISSVRATRDFAETGQITPEVRAEVAINPDSEMLPVTRANGVALTLSVPSGGLITGTSALITMDGWTWEDLTVRAPVAMHINWPRMSPRRAWWVSDSDEKQLERRDSQIEQIKSAFRMARAYDLGKDGQTARSNTRWAALTPVINGEIPVFAAANGILEIQAVVNWAVDEGLRIAIVGGYDAPMAAGLLKESDVPVIISGVHRLPRREWEGYDTPFTVPVRLLEAGVRFCIAGSGGSFSTSNARNLPHHAGTAVAHGLPYDEAVKAITLYPAQILGVGDRLGSLEAGKDATIIVVDGDPLEVISHVEIEFIEGRRIDLSSRHTQLYDKYRQKYEH